MDSLFERFYMSMSPFETLELDERREGGGKKVESELVRNPVEILLS